jgi:hypothetical protein
MFRSAQTLGINPAIMAGMVLPDDVVSFGNRDHAEVVDVKKRGKYREITCKQVEGEVWTGKTVTRTFHEEFVVFLLGTFRRDGEV